MAEIQFGLMMRAQFPPNDDMSQRFAELVEQARLANRLGYGSITKGIHYSAAPRWDVQQVPFLSRIMTARHRRTDRDRRRHERRSRDPRRRARLSRRRVPGVRHLAEE